MSHMKVLNDKILEKKVQEIHNEDLLYMILAPTSTTVHIIFEDMLTTF
jgi:hypothetical protein